MIGTRDHRPCDIRCPDELFVATSLKCARPAQRRHRRGLAWLGKAHDNMRGPPNREGQNVKWEAGFSRGLKHLLCLRWRLSRRGQSGFLPTATAFLCLGWRFSVPRLDSRPLDGHVSDDPRGMCGVQDNRRSPFHFDRLLARFTACTLRRASEFYSRKQRRDGPSSRSREATIQGPSRAHMSQQFSFASFGLISHPYDF
jgi:hypothetical protein